MHMSTEDGQQLSAQIRFIDEAAWVHHEASQNAAAMVLQSRKSGFGARQIASMIRRGCRPDINHSHVSYDPVSGDYGYLLQFANRAPVPLLLSEAELDIIRLKQWIAKQRSER